MSNYDIIESPKNHIRTKHSKTTWWRHHMETFFALLALCEGNSPVSGEFSTQRPVTRSFGVLFDLRLNKRLSKQSWGWWFETPSSSLWRHCNDIAWYILCLELLVDVQSDGSAFYFIMPASLSNNGKCIIMCRHWHFRRFIWKLN